MMRTLQRLPVYAAAVLAILSFLAAAALLLWPGFGAAISPGYLGPLEFANRVRVAEVSLTVAGFSGTIAALITAYQVVQKGQKSPRLIILPATKQRGLSRPTEGHYIMRLPFHSRRDDGGTTYVALLDMTVQNNGDLTATQFAVLVTPRPAGQSPEIQRAGRNAINMKDGHHTLFIFQEGGLDFGWEAICAGTTRGFLRYGDYSDLVPGDELGLPTLSVTLSVPPPKSTDNPPRYPSLLIRALASNARYSEVTLDVSPDKNAGEPQDEASE